MKKKDPGRKGETIRNVVIYREDLEEIMHSFNARGMTVTISDSGFEYETIDEVIKQRGSRPREIEIAGESTKDQYESVSVSFSPSRTWVYSSGSGTARELWYEVFDFLKKRRSWRKQIANPWIWYFVAIIAFNIEIFGFLQESLRIKTPFWVHAGLLIAMFTWPLSYVYSRSLATVRLTRRNEGGFWSRNQEALILLAIGAILGGIVTYIVTILTK